MLFELYFQKNIQQLELYIFCLSPEWFLSSHNDLLKFSKPVHCCAIFLRDPAIYFLRFSCRLFPLQIKYTQFCIYKFTCSLVVHRGSSRMRRGRWHSPSHSARRQTAPGQTGSRRGSRTGSCRWCWYSGSCRRDSAPCCIRPTGEAGGNFILEP